MVDESAIIPEDLRDGLTTAADTLNAHNISYAVIGGMAAGHRAQPRFTKDLDLLLQVPQLQLPALLEALRQKGFEFDLLTTVREWTQHHMTTLTFRGIPVDWLKPVIPLYQHVLDRATEQNWFDRPIRVASVEGLILLKLLAYRTQDLLDIENLVALHRDTLDLDWIRSEWSAIESLDDPRVVRLMELAGTR
jgi:Nucleotidyl transferase AbiEii toxin, Type IV TA system